VVGSTIRDEGNQAEENYVSDKKADYYAKLYKENRLKGGHIILLNSKKSEYYDETKRQAFQALNAYKNGMQVGGGINAENAMEFIDAGASHVIVTSYVFLNGKLNYENLYKINSVVGKERLVLDLSCRKKENEYYIVTDRWQKFTNEKIDNELLDRLSEYCDEFLIHAVDVEGKNNGIEKELVKILGKWNKIPITYAGGIKSLEDIKYLDNYSEGKLDFTIGSALDLFGGNLEFDKIVKLCKTDNYCTKK
jgi:phosphoribosylformimino-5-aminoimidazole carboxamide ribotide isomerase